MDSTTDVIFTTIFFLFLLKMSSLVFFFLFIFKRQEKIIKDTKYRLAQQPKKNLLNKMKTLWDLFVAQNIYPEHLPIYIYWEKKKKNHTAKGKDIIA